MQKENKLSLRIWGRMALFSDPITRMGGEKFSYPIPTYQALKGVMESIYWKPSMVWVIDRLRVLNPIRTESRGIRPIGYRGNKNTLSMYAYLADVSYQVESHFEWNKFRPDLSNDHNENKHFFIARRMLERGGRRDVFLGTRECQAYVEPCRFGEGAGSYDGVDMSFGIMVHGFDYPQETGGSQLVARFWQPQMVNGVIEFCLPEECTLKREIREYSIGPAFVPGENFSSVDVLVEEEGGLP